MKKETIMWIAIGILLITNLITFVLVLDYPNKKSNDSNCEALLQETQDGWQNCSDEWENTIEVLVECSGALEKCDENFGGCVDDLVLCHEFFGG